ncbi:unnamed protein product [Mucor hiemalis]
MESQNMVFRAMPKADWKAELGLVDKMLTMDARNFHGWNYRRYVVSHLKQAAQSEEEILLINQQEYEFTTKKINQSFSNYSAWHQRSKLLPDIVKSMDTEERNAVAINELDLVKAAIYTDPEDQSAWLYYWWLLGRAPEQVECTNALQLKGSSLVFLGFNDAINFMELPKVYNEKNESLLGKLYPLCHEKDEKSSIWIFSLDISTATAARIHIQSETILPSTASSSIPTNMKWDISVNQLDYQDVSERVEALKCTLVDSWSPFSTKMYKDPTLNDQTAWFTLDKTQLLKDEIQTVRDLLELEPDSAWSLQTLVHFLGQLILRGLKK